MFVVLIVSRERGQTAIPSCTVLSQCAGDMSRKFGVLHSSSEDVVCSVTEKGLLAWFLLLLVEGPLRQPLCWEINKQCFGSLFRLHRKCEVYRRSLR